jgi:uncharacterized protein (TIGR02001 family)
LKGFVMQKKILSLAVLAALGALSTGVLADDAAPAAAPAAAAPAAPASPWTVTTNVNLVSDYYFRGISQTWHKPAVQGGLDISHSSGFYIGTWLSNVSEEQFPGGGLEIDYYGGYNGTFGDAIKDLGWTVGGYGYYYPGAHLAPVAPATSNEDMNTFELNAGLSYKWLSTKVSVDVTDWYGANRNTGFNSDTKGSYYWQLDAAYPIGDWTLVGHVAREEISSDLAKANLPATSTETDPSYWDYKFGVSKAFKIAASDGWSAGIYYMGATNSDNSDYWGKAGFGGGSSLGNGKTTDLAAGHFVVTVGRVF